jgi:hypothetical protein
MVPARPVRAAEDRRRLTSLRMCAQLLAGNAAGSAAEAVRHLLALQGQDYPGVLWSAAIRAQGAVEADVTDAIARGDLVRSWPLRGTLHLLAPEDLRWMLDLTAERTLARSQGVYRARDLDESVFDRARDLLTEELAGRPPRTRRELMAVMERAGLDPSGQRGINILGNLALKQVLVVGPHDGKQPTFALLDEWVRPGDRPERDDALGRLALRYFTGHGPATVRDLAWWSGLTLTEARRGRDVALPKLATLELGVGDADEPLHLSPDVLDAEGAAEIPEALMLAGFDEFLLGYSDRSAAIAPDQEELVVPGKNGLFLSTMVRSGEVVGTWRRTLTPKEVRFDLRPFKPLLEEDLAAFSPAAEHFARFLGRTAHTPLVAPP